MKEHLVHPSLFLSLPRGRSPRRPPRVPPARSRAGSARATASPFPASRVTLDGPAGERRVTTGPDGTFRGRRASRRRLHRVGGRSRPRGARAPHGHGRRRRRPARPRPRPGAGRRAGGGERHPRRGDALLARHRGGRARPRADRRPRRPVAPAAPPGSAGRRHRAGRPDGPPGLRLHPRGRVALRARSRGRRAGQPAGRRLRLRHRPALRARARRGRARGGEQPLRDRRPGRRREPADATGAAGRPPSLRAEGEGGSFDWQRFLGATSGARGRLDWNAGSTAAHHGQRASRTAASSRRRRRSPRG